MVNVLAADCSDMFFNLFDDLLVHDINEGIELAQTRFESIVASGSNDNILEPYVDDIKDHMDEQVGGMKNYINNKFMDMKNRHLLISMVMPTLINQMKIRVPLSFSEKKTPKLAKK